MSDLIITRHLLGQVINDCWWVFLAVWFLARFNVKRTAESQKSASLFVYVVICFACVGMMFLRGPLLFGRTVALGSVGAALTILGVATAVWARLVLGRNWSGSVTYKEDHELVEKGPYRFVRHPIYTGLLLMFLGTAVFNGTAVATLAFAIITAVHIWKMRLEEALMTRHFPEAYPAYAARTKALVPYLF